jgi:hypothetical protein
MLRTKHNLLAFSAAVAIGLLVYCANIYVVSNNTAYKYAIELWNYGCEFLNFLYPLIFSVPFCWLLFHEKNGSYWKNVFNRAPLSRYIARRVCVSVLMSAAAMLIVSLGGLLFAYCAANGPIAEYEPMMDYKFYGAYQLSHPIAYAAILSGARALLAALYTALGIGVSMISKNIFIAMTGPFVYSIGENFITAILQAPKLSICTSFYPNRLSSAAVDLPSLMAGPAIMLAAIAAIYLYYLKKEKYMLMD